MKKYRATSIVRFQILNAFMKTLGWNDIPNIVVEANMRLGNPFFVCKNYFGESEIMPVPEQRSETFARIMGNRMRYSGGWMVLFDGEEFELVGWENWSEVYAELSPKTEEKVTWGIVDRRPRRTEAERIFEDGKKRRADLPKLMRADQIMVLLQA